MYLVCIVCSLLLKTYLSQIGMFQFGTLGNLRILLNVSMYPQGTVHRLWRIGWMYSAQGGTSNMAMWGGKNSLVYILYIL